MTMGKALLDTFFRHSSRWEVIIGFTDCPGVSFHRFLASSCCCRFCSFSIAEMYSPPAGWGAQDIQLLSQTLCALLLFLEQIY